MPAIKVGIPVSLTGQFQTQGRQALAGLQAWVGDVNRAGGLTVGHRRYHVQQVHYDDASLAEKAAAATRRLIRKDGVDLLFGPYSSGLAQAAAEISAQEGQILWNQGGAAEAIYQPGSRVAGILSGAREYLAALPDLFHQANSSASTFGIVRCSTGAFPRQVSEGLETEALALGFTKVAHLEFPPDQKDFGAVAREATAAQPDLLVAVGRIRHDIALAKELASALKESGQSLVTAVVAAPIERFRNELGSAVDGFVGPSQWEPSRGESRLLQPADFFGPSPSQALSSLDRAAKSSGLPIDYPMAQAYAAGLVAQRCLQEAGSLERELLWETAGRLDFHTFFGRFKIDPDTGRQVGRSVFMVQWQEGRKVVIWPPERAQGKLAVP